MRFCRHKSNVRPNNNRLKTGKATPAVKRVTGAYGCEDIELGPEMLLGVGGLRGAELMGGFRMLEDLEACGPTGPEPVGWQPVADEIGLHCQAYACFARHVQAAGDDALKFVSGWLYDTVTEW